MDVCTHITTVQYPYYYRWFQIRSSLKEVFQLVLVQLPHFLIGHIQWHLNQKMLLKWKPNQIYMKFTVFIGEVTQMTFDQQLELIF